MIFKIGCVRMCGVCIFLKGLKSSSHRSGRCGLFSGGSARRGQWGSSPGPEGGAFRGMMERGGRAVRQAHIFRTDSLCLKRQESCSQSGVWIQAVGHEAVTGRGKGGVATADYVADARKRSQFCPGSKPICRKSAFLSLNVSNLL